MKILLTGGTGFIGSHLLLHLLEKHYDVVSVRRPGSAPVLPSPHNLICVDRALMDLTRDDFLDIDVVIHLASAGVSPRETYWKDLEQTNVAASIHLMQVACQAGVRRFVVTGTCLEYGVEGEKWKNIPPTAPLQPNTPYAASKAAAYHMLNVFAKLHPIEFLYARIFNVYGKGQFSGNLWPSLRNAALSGEDFAMTDGNQIRDFIHISDVVKYLLIGIERTDLTPGSPLVVNIGTGEGVRVKDFAIQQWDSLNAIGCLKLGSISTNVNNISSLVADTIGLTPFPLDP